MAKVIEEGIFVRLIAYAMKFASGGEIVCGVPGDGSGGKFGHANKCLIKFAQMVAVSS